MNLKEKLQLIQTELKAPKNQYNSFGKYKYRSCEDIQEGVKPLLEQTKTSLVVGDEIIMVGERYYVKATATLMDCESEDVVTNTSYAREEESKKGMDGSQVTGTSSSYARKYALNGLFCIDDTKDSDSTNKGEDGGKKEDNKADEPKDSDLITQKEAMVLTTLVKKKGLDITKVFNVPVEQLNQEQYVQALNQLEKLRDKEAVE